MITEPGFVLNAAGRFLVIMAVVLVVSVAWGNARADSQAACDGIPAKAARIVYVVGNGWHTSIVLSRADLSATSWPRAHDFSNSEFLEVSWGDWDYFQTPDASTWLALKAALVPTRSVLHVVGFDGAVPAAYPGADVVEVHVSPAGLDDLVEMISDTFSTTDTTPRPGLFPGSRFYAARGTFHLFNTCNNWIARLLRAAGCPNRPGRAITAESVLRQTRRFGTVIARRDRE